MGGKRGRRVRRRRVPASFWAGVGVGLVLAVAAFGVWHDRKLPDPSLDPPYALAKRSPKGADPRTAEPGRAPGDAAPRIAIVIDDLGDSLGVAREVLALSPAVTVAVIPHRPASAAVARAAIEAGREVILHLPLEPEERSEMEGGAGVLRTGMTAAGLERQLDADLDVVPYIVGVNGHMGSRFTRDPAAMETLLTALHARGLFFLDSKTSAASVAADTARRVGVRFAERTLFLDHDPSLAAVEKQLDALAATARKEGAAIAIGHPHRSTLAALGAWLPAAERQGIRVVPASALAR